MPESKRAQAADAQAKEAPQPMGWLQLMSEFSTTMKATFGEPMPGEFWQHVRTSHKEGLLAMRSLIDARIARLEAEEEALTERKATKIPVN